MKILLINLAVGAPSHGVTYRSHHLAQAWAKLGNEVVFVGSTYSHLLTTPPRKLHRVWRNRENGVDYLLLPTIRYKGSGFSRLLNFLNGLFGLLRLPELLPQRWKPEIILAATVHQMDNFAAVSLAKRYGSIFVRETRDLWPLTLVELGKYSANNPFVRLIGAAEKTACRKAAILTTTLPNSRDHFVQRGLMAERWHYLPQCPSPPVIPEPVPALHKERLITARRTGCLIGVFAGSIVPAANLAAAVQAAAQIRNGKLNLFIVGKGPCEASLRNQIATLRADNVHVLPPVSKGSIPSLLAQADFGFAGGYPLPLYRFGISPNKIFDYMSAGLPVVLNLNSPKNPVELGNCGFIADPEYPNMLANVFNRVANLSRDQRKVLGENGRNHIQVHHNFTTMALRYIELLKDNLTYSTVR